MLSYVIALHNYYTMCIIMLYYVILYYYIVMLYYVMTHGTILLCYIVSRD